MKNKTLLPLMEQLVMILVFALAATMCIQGFVLANRISANQEARAQAVIPAQNTAELLKQTAGDYEEVAQIMSGTWDGQRLTIPAHGDAVVLVTPLETAQELLGSAQIQVVENEEILFEITTAWQEVNPHVIP